MATGSDPLQVFKLPMVMRVTRSHAIAEIGENDNKIILISGVFI